MVDTQWPGEPKRAAPIHRGRLFVVYRVIGARDESIIVKTPRPDRADPGVEMLRHEYRILRGLPVQGVCQPLALEEQDDHPALVLEDAGPIDLERWLGLEPADLRTFRVLALQLAHAVARVHAAGVVHRDITPANIVVDPRRERATLVDFDLAAVRCDPALAAPAIAHEAALPYLAPEQTGAVDLHIDQRVDLYALGSIFFRMLTGAPPAPAGVPPGDPPFVPPSSVNPDVPGSLDEIVRHLLSAHPDDRYARAEPLVDDLHRLAADLGPRSPRVRRSEARNRLLAALTRARAGGCAIGVLAGPPGSGKTALATALRSDVEAAGGVFLFGSCGVREASGEPAIVAAFASAVRAILREPEENVALARRRLRRTLGSRVEWLATHIPELADLAGMDRPAPRRTRHAPDGDLCMGLCDLAVALRPPRAPLALVLDDLHEANAQALRVLRGLMFAPQMRRSLVVAALDAAAVTPLSALDDTLAAMRAADPALSWIELGALDAGSPARGREPPKPIAGLTAEIQAQARAERWERWLADATADIFAPLASPDVYEPIARAYVPELADLCTLEIVAEDGSLRRVAAVDADPSKQPVLDELDRFEDGWRTPRLLVPIGDLNAPCSIPSVTEDTIEREAVCEQHARILRALGIRSVLALPLKAGGGRLAGRLHLARRSGGSYRPPEVTLAGELARRAGAALERARVFDEMQQAIRLRDEFLSIAAHELSTPVTSLKLGIEGIRSGTIPATADNLERAFRIAERQVSRLGRLIGELLSVSRIRAGTLELRLERVDLAEVVRDAAERLEEEAQRAGSKIEIQAAPGAVGTWDRTRVDQVATNLLSNAIKFGRGSPIDVTVEVNADSGRLVVHDRGIGIPQDKMSSVLERFVRGVSSRQYAGLGLGLYIVTQIVRALGGTLDVSSAPNHGSTFTVELPRSGPPAGRVPAPADVAGRRSR